MSEADEAAAIDAKVTRLATLGSWQWARDRLSAAAPTPFAAEVRALGRLYPFVAGAADWLAFLRRYGGGMLVRNEDMLSIGLYGFSHDVSLHLLEGPGEPVEAGCLLFADVVLPRQPVSGITDDTVSLGFGFPADGARRFGVYRVRGGHPEWYCDHFGEWLDQLVHARGRLLDDA